MKIEIINPVECRVKKAFARSLIPCLSFKAEYWDKADPSKGRYGKKRREYNKSMFFHKDSQYWYFWTGLLPRVDRFCQRKNIPLRVLEISNVQQYNFSPSPPNLNGIVFRDDQLEHINTAIKSRCGIIKAPTGSGKTIVFLGILSAYRASKALVLAHRIDIVQQTYDELVKFGFDPTILGGKHKELLNDPRILVSTMQTYIKWVKKGIDPKYFNIVIVDECFHGNTKIYIKNGRKFIKNIRKGDVVYTSKGLKKVKRTFKTKVPLSEVVKITSSNGKIIYCSKEHLFHSKGKWIKAIDLSKKDVLTSFVR